MTHKRLIAGLLVTGLVAGQAVRTHAFGLVVYDPSVFAQAVQQVIQLTKQVDQLTRQYLVLRSQYEQMLWNARRVPVNMVARYRAVATPWAAGSASNTYGTAGPWVLAANTGVNVAAAYARTTEPLRSYGATLAGVPGIQQASLKTTYGTLELSDGVTQGTLEAIGRLRANAPAVGAAIAALEDDSLSAAPEMNTEVAVLNKINAANLVSVRAAQDTNQLLVALAEQEAVSAKRLRDAQARAINQHVTFISEGQQVMAAQAAGTTAAFRAWRLP